MPLALTTIYITKENTLIYFSIHRLYCIFIESVTFKSLVTILNLFMENEYFNTKCIFSITSIKKCVETNLKKN